MFKNWKYATFVAASCFVDPIIAHSFYTYVPDFVIHTGYSGDKSWGPITVSGAMNTLSRFSMGITNKSRRVITVVYATSVLIVGGLLLLYAVPVVGHHYWIICVNAAVFGLGKRLIWSIKGPVLAEVVPIEYFDRSLGTEQTLGGILLLACALQGKLFDITGEYTWPFVSVGTMASLGEILLWVRAGTFPCGHSKDADGK